MSPIILLELIEKFLYKIYLLSLKNTLIIVSIKMKNSYLTKKSIIEKIIVVFSYRLMRSFMEMRMDIILFMN